MTTMVNQDRQVQLLIVIRTAIYVRVSTDKQEEDGTSLDTQVENCLEYAKQNGLTVVAIYRETFTGALYRERPQLTNLRESYRKGELDAVLFNTFDRLSRNQIHLGVLIDEMEHYSIRIECVKEQFDNTATGQFMRNALAFVAQVEREKISYRTDTGRRERARNGKLIPGWKPRYGYIWANEGKTHYVINPQEAQVVKSICEDYDNGGTFRGIAKKLNEKNVPTPSGKGYWCDATVRRILEDPIYIGRASSFKYDSTKKVAGRVRNAMRPQEEQIALPEGTVPPIIELALFSRIQERIKINKIDAPRNNPYPEASLLRCGFVKCGYCGRVMSVSGLVGKGNNTREYRCSYACRPGIPCPRGATISIHRIDEIVWDYVGEIIQDFSMVAKALDYWRGKNPGEFELKPIENSIKNARVSQEMLAQDLRKVDANGQPKLKGRARDLVLDDLEKLEAALGALEEERQKVIDGQIEWQEVQVEVDKFVAWCLQSRETYPNATYEEKRRALRVLGILVTVYREDDREHDRYQITVRIPDIVSRIS